jgi:hypothetical protein
MKILKPVALSSVKQFLLLLLDTTSLPIDLVMNRTFRVRVRVRVAGVRVSCDESFQQCYSRYKIEQLSIRTL